MALVHRLPSTQVRTTWSSSAEDCYMEETDLHLKNFTYDADKGWSMDHHPVEATLMFCENGGKAEFKVNENWIRVSVWAPE